MIWESRSITPMARSTKRTPEELAAFKAANLAACKTTKTVQLWPVAKPARKTQRQQFEADLRETEDMIRAAKRQGHWQLLPALLQRHSTLFTLANHRAIN